MLNWLKRNFVPHEENGYTPHILQKAAIVGMLIMILISFSIANLQSLIWISSNWLVSSVLPAVVAEETNEARASARLPSLVRSSTLDLAAQMKAEDMAKNGYFAHTSPTGVTPWRWFQDAGYRYTHAGENLAVHFTDSSAVVEAWLNSPSHRDNILNGNYKEIGIGTAAGRYEGYETVFVVQMFGSPAAQQVQGENPRNEAAITAEGENGNVGTPIVAGVTDDDVVSLTDNGTVVYESFASTEDSSAVPALPADSDGSSSQPATLFGKIATSPSLLLQIVYSVMGLFVLSALFMVIFIEWRRGRPVQIAYSLGLLLIMVALFHVHLAVSGGAVVA